jgi:hypothetical protein
MQIVERITALESQMAQLVRVGLVTLVLPKKGKVRVRIHDDECLDTYELTVLYPKTRLDKYYRMPDVGEQVLCIFLPGRAACRWGLFWGPCTPSWTRCRWLMPTKPGCTLRTAPGRSTISPRAPAGSRTWKNHPSRAGDRAAHQLLLGPLPTPH